MSSPSAKINEDLDCNIYFTIVEKNRYIQEAKETSIDSNKRTTTLDANPSEFPTG